MFRNSITFLDTIGLSIALCLSPIIAVAGVPENEVIVLWKSGAVQAPMGLSNVDCNTSTIRSEELASFLRVRGIATMRRISPWFRPDGAASLNEAGVPLPYVDRSLLFLLQVSPETREQIVEELKARPEVIHAEPNQRVASLGFSNDPEFNRQWNLLNNGQYAGKVDGDIDAPWAWNFSQGALADHVAVIDPGDGVESSHAELTGRITGSGGSTFHSTHMAGILGAKGNNNLGVAGVNWNGTIQSQPFDGTVAGAINAIAFATDQGIKIHNDAWSFESNSSFLDQEFARGYMNNVLSCVASPETGRTGIYPISFGHGILGVGATSTQDLPAQYTLGGTFVDVAAPGGNQEIVGQRDIYSTVPA